MGMAASQARFLGLTARKTNVEYEGQQVNQQRTVLSNESAGLFNQMLELQVPTPPSATDYYNTRYVFDSMGEDFSITKFDTSSGGVGAYNIVLEYSETERKGYSSVPITQGTPMAFNDKTPTKIYLNGKEYEITLADATGVDKGNIEIINSAIVANDSTRKPENDTYYKYTVNQGETDERTYYISSYDINNASLPSDPSEMYTGGLTQYFAQDATVKKKSNATASFQATNDGRFESVTITGVDNESLNQKLAGKTFELDLTQVDDSEGYEAAMKDYEYQKMMYERAIQDINARTEIIQQQDRTLELRLKQLDTEQEALKTEMDAVKDVIQKNVESTFKTVA